MYFIFTCPCPRTHHLVTPLMLAAEAGDLELVTTLLEFDARVEDKDKDGNNAIAYANKKKKVGVRRILFNVSD